jgi:hypothetical protein
MSKMWWRTDQLSTSTMNHPKVGNIRLPFSVPKPGRSSAPTKICGMFVSSFLPLLGILTKVPFTRRRCRKRDSKYICPRCNIAYCSLECFRTQVSCSSRCHSLADKHQTHAQCSEGFYKETVRESIESDPKASLEERKAMVEMLKRFEEGQVDGQSRIEGLDDDEDEDAEDELLRALEGVDIGEQPCTQLVRLRRHNADDQSR